MKYLPVFYYLRKYVNTDKLIIIYNSFIQSNFLYCILVWGNPVQNRGPLDHLLILQKKIARIITFAPLLEGAKVHTPPIFHQLKMLTINEIYQQQITCLARDLLAGQSTNVQIKLVFNHKFHPQNTRESENKFALHVGRTISSIGDRGIKHSLEINWNNLPEHLQSSFTKHRQEFKTIIRAHIFKQHTDTFKRKTEAKSPLVFTGNTVFQWKQGDDSASDDWRTLIERRLANATEKERWR
jgi:hypothetical protein